MSAHTPASSLDWALFLARKGLAVFPMRYGTKDGFLNSASDHGATKDPHQIRKLFAHQCNIGIWLGTEFVAICPDFYREGAREAWAQMQRDLGQPLPLTLASQTARTGNHLFYRTGGKRFSQSSPWGNLIDIRAQGGYVVGPGSVYVDPEDGKAYPYSLARDVPEIPVIPEALADRLSRRAERPASMEPLIEPDQPGALDRGWRLADETPPASEGNRNAAAHKLAGLIKAQGVSEDLCCEMVLQWNDGNHPPLDDAEIEKAVESSYRNGDWRIGEHDPTRHFAVVETAPQKAQSPAGALIELFDRACQRAGAQYEIGRQSVAQQARTPQLAPTSIDIKWTYEHISQKSMPWSIDELALPGSWGFITGGTRMKKTFILTHMCMCLDSGRPFFGRKISERGGSIIVAGEAAYATPQRTEAARLYGFRDVERPAIAYTGAPPNLLNAKTLGHFIDDLRRLGSEMQRRHGVPLRMVAFDTFVKCFSVNEDKASEVTQAHNAMERIAEALQVVVICAAHIGKDAARGIRGSSAHSQNAHFCMEIPKEGHLYLAKVKEAPDGMLLGRFETPLVDLGKAADGKACNSLAIREVDLGPFDEIVAPEDKGIGQKALRLALLAASDGSVQNPVDPDKPAATMEAVRAKFVEAYPQGKDTHPDESKGRVRTAWSRTVAKPPADIVVDEEAGIIYCTALQALHGVTCNSA